MSYDIQQYNDGVRVLNPSGEEIYRFTGDGYYEEQIQEAILADANFGNPQKSALKGLLGHLDVDTYNESLPS